ncbi:unnamed protein product [Bursaphelenchus okinawaensis]|uniref:RNA helicase n=1 Tax=Bursaphelenchus okinawaensis TaxID=465554 RepID=A0A811LLC5_9BILA|nr:unnamed protein product [Bursaphelenchus okinawaensis]CAG9125254.1 unnamed protein product [Bursaphelenchus okinawaensis]
MSTIKRSSTFDDFELDDRLLQAIRDQQWKKPTQIQETLIPMALEGKNIIARARTGSGKSAAFLLPIIQKVLANTDKNGDEGELTTLIVAPTKELATQLFKLNTSLTLRFPFLQAVNLSENESAGEDVLLQSNVDFLFGTPGRILELIKKKEDLLKKINTVVLDEADLLFSYGYKEELVELKEHLPKKFQVIMTSATIEEDMTDIKKLFVTGTLASVMLKEGNLPGTDQLTQYSIFCNNDEERFTILVSLIKLKLLAGKAIFFVSSIDRCYKLHLFLQGFKIKSCVLNSQMPANSRSHVINEFNEGKYKYIIASEMKDVGEGEEEEPKKKKKKQRIKHDKESGVSRGIDFHFVSNVINFDFPWNLDNYIHRVGRTARGFNKGTAISFVAENEKKTFESVRDEINEQVGEEVIMPYEVRMDDFDSFLIRSREVLSAITKTVIREVRLDEIKRELLASRRLEAYFAKNPRERSALENDRKMFVLNLHSTGIADVADYMVPKALKGRDYTEPEFEPIRRKRKQNQNKHAKNFKKRSNDPLKSFAI